VHRADRSRKSHRPERLVISCIQGEGIPFAIHAPPNDHYDCLACPIHAFSYVRKFPGRVVEGLNRRHMKLQFLGSVFGFEPDFAEPVVDLSFNANLPASCKQNPSRD